MTDLGENTALLPRRPPQPPRLSPLMTRMLGEKRTASFSPPPLSRRAPAPPSTPIGDHGSMVDTPRNSISESSPTLPSGISTPSSRSQSQTRDKISSWTRRIMPTLVLENSGSVARDHLSSERTFLAYVRTSLAIASTGVALVQLFTISGFSTNQSSVTLTTPRIQIYARPLGAVTVVMGLVVLVIGLVRYFSIQTSLTNGRFPVARVAIAFIAVTLCALVVIVFGVLVGVKR